MKIDLKLLSSFKKSIFKVSNWKMNVFYFKIYLKTTSCPENHGIFILRQYKIDLKILNFPYKCMKNDWQVQNSSITLICYFTWI